MSSGLVSAGELIEIFSAPALSTASASSTERIPPATQNGMSEDLGDAPHPVAVDAAPSGLAVMS
jgi:hypothetical protein